MLVELPIITGTHKAPETGSGYAGAGVRHSLLENFVPIRDIDGRVYLQQSPGLQNYLLLKASGNRYGRGMCLFSDPTASGGDYSDGIACIVDTEFHYVAPLTASPSDATPGTISSAINTTAGKCPMVNFQDGSTSLLAWGNHRDDTKGVGTYTVTTDTQNVSAVIGSNFVFPASTGVGSPRDIAYLNRQLIGEDGQSWATSAPASTQIDTTNRLAESEAKPDRLRGIAVAGPYLYALNTRSIEIYQNTGSGKPPFSRLPTGVIGRGIRGPYLYCVDDETNDLYFIDNTGMPCRLNGIQTQEIGNAYISADFRNLSTTFGHVFKLKLYGQTAICFRQTAGTSQDLYVYYPAFDLWGTLAGYPIYDAVQTLQNTISDTELNFCLGDGTGYLYYLDHNSSDNDFTGARTISILETPFVTGDNAQGVAGDYVYHDSIEVRLAAPQNVAVTAFTLEYNDKNGIGSWTDAGAGSLYTGGENGIDLISVKWHGLGRSTRRVYRLTMESDADNKVLGVRSVTADLKVA